VKLEKIDFDYQFQIVENWLFNRDYVITQFTGAEDSVCYNTREVLINTRKHVESRFYTLLHECGHILINDNRDRLYKLSRETQAHWGKKPARSRRIAVLSEEVEAWKRGERLAKKLGLKINERKFDTARTNALMSYVEWARD